MTEDKYVRWTVYVVVGAVALFAFGTSYIHIYDLSRSHGQHGMAARMLPLSVDLLIVAASLVLFLQARAPVRATGLARFMPRLMLWAGIVATIAANVADGWAYGILGAVISAWSGAIFAGLVEMVMVAVRPQSPEVREAVNRTVIPAGQAVIPSSAYDAALAAHAASRAGGNPLTEYQLAKRFGIPRSQARKICALPGPAPAPPAADAAPASMNGDGHE